MRTAAQSPFTLLLRVGLALLLATAGLAAAPAPEAAAAGIVGPGRYENTSGDIAYAGTWASASSGSDSGGSIATLAGTGYAEITFRETSVTWVARTASHMGIANVYLDGKQVTTVDLYSAANGYKKSAYTSPTLAYGTHTLRIERSGTKNSASSGRTVNVDSFVVADSRAPATPGGLAVAPAGSGARLTWDANPESDIAGYRVYRATGDATTYTQLTDTPVAGTSYTDPALTPGTSYRYGIAAVDTSGNASERTADVTVTGNGDVANAATYENTAKEITYTGSWSSASSGSDSGGSIATLAGPGYAQLAFRETRIRWVARTANFMGIANVYLDGKQVATVDLYSPENGFKSTVYTSPTLSYGTHTLRVERSGDKNAASSGRTVNVDSFVVVDSQAPAPPTGLAGETSGADAKLTWAAPPGDDVAGYYVYRAAGSNTTYTRLNATPVAGTAFTDPGPTPATSYRYRVTAVDTSGNESDPTTDVEVVSMDAVDDGVYENTDLGISYTGSWTTSSSTSDSKGSSAQLASPGFAQLSFKETSVTWIARTANHLGIANVYLDGRQVATVDLYSPETRYKTVAYVSPTLDYGTHTLRIERSGEKNSASSGRTINVDKFFVADSRPPAVPSGLAATPSGSGARLSWTRGSEPDTAGYLVYRAAGTAEDYLQLTPDPVSGTSFLDPRLGPNATYRYRIAAVDDAGNASARTEDTVVRSAATSGTYPATSSAVTRTGSWDPEGDDPTMLTASSAASASLTFNETNVRWVGPRTPEGGLAKVYLDGVLDATVDQYAATSTPDATLYEKEGLAAGAHTVRVEWTGEHGSAGGSGTATTTIARFVVGDTSPPDAPQEIDVEPSGTSILVRWAGSSDADLAGYRVYRSKGNDRDFVPVTDQLEPGPDLVDSNLEPGTTYWYRVATVDRSGNESVKSPSAAATTALSTGSVENEAAAVRYTTSWSTTSAPQDSEGSYAVGAETGASASLTFSGTGIRWVTRTNSYSGIAQVSIDGEPVAKVDLYSADLQYQQPVFTKLNLGDGTHVITIERTGTLNPASTGRSISLDRFEVLDSTPPPTMPRPTLQAQRLGIEVSWPASPAPDVAAYRLYRENSAGTEIELDRLPASQRSFIDVSLPAATTYTYRVTAIDSSGNESVANRGDATTLKAPPDVEVPQRYANCPTATRTVSTTGALQNAMATAQPGDVIRLAPGTYTGPSTITTRATATNTIWVCGPRTAVIDLGGTTAGTAVAIKGASYVTLTGMTIRNAAKGVFVTGSDHVVVSDVALSEIGEEAIHLKTFTTDSTVVGNEISNTGRWQPAFGEGVYVGSDPSVWCDQTNCEPDRSDRNQVVDNAIVGTTAEGVEAKAGTSDGLIEGNTFDGARMAPETSGGWVVVKGNAWLVNDNRGVNAPENGFTATYSKAAGWGGDNVFVRNQAEVGNATGYGVWLQKNIGNIAGCYNITADGTRVVNLPCQR